MSKPCSYCGADWHLAFSCPVKPRKAIKNIGKVTKRWQSTRLAWVKSHPAPWFCYMCGIELVLPQELSERADLSFKNILTLDHLQSRSHNPALRFTDSNLAPCCWLCNNKKGSSSVDKVMEGEK